MPVAEIPDGDYPGREGGRGIRAHPLQQRVVGSALQMSHRCDAGSNPK
jgi:hypothetical protein